MPGSPGVLLGDDGRERWDRTKKAPATQLGRRTEGRQPPAAGRNLGFSLQLFASSLQSLAADR